MQKQYGDWKFMIIKKGVVWLNQAHTPTVQVNQIAYFF